MGLNDATQRLLTGVEVTPSSTPSHVWRALLGRDGGSLHMHE